MAIELDGQGEADLSEVFAWEEGKFEIVLDPKVPAEFREDEAPTLERPAAPRRREDTRQFLRVVEMALADVVHESERARSPTRTSPPLPPPPKARPRPRTLPPPSRQRDEQTVRLIYLGGDPPEVRDDASTRHVSKGDAELALTEARPERRRAALPEPREMADDEKNDEAGETGDEAAPGELSESDASAGENEAESAELSASESADANDGEGAEGSESETVDAAANPDDEESAEAGGEAHAETSPAGKSASPPVRPAVAVAGAVGWSLGFILIALVILAVLAHLPPVQ